MIKSKLNKFYSRNKTFAYWMPMRDLPKLPLLPDFNRSLPTTIYFHGWLENGTLDMSTVAIRGGYLDAGGHNVLTADWSKYSKDLYYQGDVIPQMQVVSYDNRNEKETLN